MVLTTAVTETQFTDKFRRFIEGEKNAELRDLREEALAHFQDVGFPTPRLEDWKYTNIAPIAKENWDFAPYSEPAVDGYLERMREFNFGRNGLAALHLAFASHFKLVVIRKDTSLDEPKVLTVGGTNGMMV